MTIKFFGFLLGIFIASTAFAHKAQAATLTVSVGCSLNSAITAVNDAANGGGCTGSGAYGTNDTINIPAGTVTQAGDTTTISKPLVISGASRSTTLINMNGFAGFTDDYGNSDVPMSQDITFANMTIFGAENGAIYVSSAKSARLNNLEIHDSGSGVALNPVTTISVTNCNIRNNTAPNLVDPEIVGLSLGLKAYDASDNPEVVISNSQITNNSSASTTGVAGLAIFLSRSTEADSEVFANSFLVAIEGTDISNNNSNWIAGLAMNDETGPLSSIPTTLQISATTVSGNVVTVTNPQEVSGSLAQLPVTSGVMLTGKLTDTQNMTNVTVANNTVNSPSPDNRTTIGGIFAVLAPSGSSLHIVNTTIAGNAVNQPNAAITNPTILALKADVSVADNVPVITSAEQYISTQNGLFVHNLFNGVPQNCKSTIDLSQLGGPSGIAGSPTNLGHNLSDDSTCTGFTVDSNLYAAMDHEVKDNGGPVPTLALHDDSTAVNAGGQVLGVSTDARGVSRNSYNSVGAYQGTILAATTTNSTTVGQLAKTGIFIALAAPVGLFLVSVPFYLYWDFRRHKEPLLAMDPAVDYTFWHHMRMVTIPVAKYRFSVALERKVPEKSDSLTRF